MPIDAQRQGRGGCTTQLIKRWGKINSEKAHKASEYDDHNRNLHMSGSLPPTLISGPSHVRTLTNAHCSNTKLQSYNTMDTYLVFFIHLHKKFGQASCRIWGRFSFRIILINSPTVDRCLLSSICITIEERSLISFVLWWQIALSG